MSSGAATNACPYLPHFFSLCSCAALGAMLCHSTPLLRPRCESCSPWLSLREVPRRNRGVPQSDNPRRFFFLRVCLRSVMTRHNTPLSRSRLSERSRREIGTHPRNGLDLTHTILPVPRHPKFLTPYTMTAEGRHTCIFSLSFSFVQGNRRLDQTIISRAGAV